jgi:hypothetical protein
MLGSCLLSLCLLTRSSLNSKSCLLLVFNDFILFKGASHRAHFELAIFLWQECAQSGACAPAADLQDELAASLERCLQLHRSNADALKALALFHSDIRRDKRAAVRVLESLAEVPLLCFVVLCFAVLS